MHTHHIHTNTITTTFMHAYQVHTCILHDTTHTQHSTCTNDPTIVAVRLPNICKDPMTPEANPTDTSP